VSTAANVPGETGDTAEQLLGRIAQVTRQLREGMRELGLDKQVERAAQAIPSARERLAYVAETTERAAHRSLNAVELAQPLQEALDADARALSASWNARFDSPLELNQARELVLATRAYLQDVPERAAAINTQLMEILMAQDFQDLTGQVIKKMMEVVNEVETSMLQVLIDNRPAERRAEGGAAASGLLNGPQTGRVDKDAVADQSQVDDLLQSLGF